MTSDIPVSGNVPTKDVKYADKLENIHAEKSK